MAQVERGEFQAIQGRLKEIKSKRARVMEAMRYLLTTIKTPAGYTWDVQEVSFDVKTWRDRAAAGCPNLYIIDDNVRMTKHAGLTREYVWTIRLFGVLREADQQRFEEFIADVEQCLYDNNSLFGEANKMEVPLITTDNQMFSELDGTHLFEMVCEVEYTRSARNSR